MSGYSRRRLLAVGGAVTAGGLAGCLGDETTTEATPTSDGPVLETISVENLNSRSHTLDIIIQWDDQIEYWEEHELAAIAENGDSSRLLEEGWPTEPGEFQLTVRLDDGTREQFSASELSDRDCLRIVVLVSRDSELSILTETSGGCDDPDDAADSDDATENTDEA